MRLLASGLAVLGLGLVLLAMAGPWLVVADRLQPADAIVVVSGAVPSRALGAADLYHQGLAGRIVVSFPSGSALRQSREHRVLQRAGVPAEAIVQLTRPVLNTREELDAVFAYAQAQGLRRLILVTSPAHTRRVRLIWNHLHERAVPAVVHPTPHERFDSSWWRSWWRIKAGLHEFGGLARFFLGTRLFESGPGPGDS
jgi:uncharacterized SAM-binding protein YcdF (DUF218 family)